MASPVQILPGDGLYRRFLSFCLKADHTLSSAVWKTKKKPEKDASVDLGRLTTPEDSLGRAPNPGFGLCSLPAKIPLSYDRVVQHTPVEGNWAHCLILGKLTKSECRDYSDGASILIPPPSQ